MANDRLSPDLVRGNVRMLVLAILGEGPSHGYAITHEIERRSDQALIFRQGTLYPLLHELEKSGLVVGNWESFGDERPKKVYTITESGRAELLKGLAEWRKFVGVVESVVGKVADEHC